MGRKMDHEDGTYGGQFGGGGPEVYSGGWSQDPGFSDGLPYSHEYPPHMGKMVRTGQGEARSETGDLTLTNITAWPDTDTGRTHHMATDQHGNVWEWSYVESDPRSYGPGFTEKDWEISYRDTDGKVHEYYRLDDGTWAEDHALEKQDENLAKDHLPPPEIQGEDENLAKGRLPLPDPVEEPAPAPGIQGVENFAKGHLPGLVEEEPPVGQQPQAEPPVQPTPPPPDHGLQENYAKDYGFPGLDVEPPISLEANLLDPIPSSGPSPFGPPSAPPSGEGEYEEQDVTPLQFGNTGNFNNTAPSGEGEYEEQDVTPLQFGNTANLENSLDPNLLDPIAPGPTLDMGLVERITQSPGLVDRVNQDPSVAEALERDPTQLDQIEQDLGVADHQRPMEPSGDSGPRFTEPSLTEQPPPESSTPDDGADDLTL